MSSSSFDIQVHRVPCQHIRQYPGATFTNQEEDLYLELKQYRPLDNLEPSPGDVTILGAHANGFPKELYEPLWDELLQRSKKNDFSIRGIWIADISHQGSSGILNEEKMGNDPSWFDHSRDMLSFINHFRDQMPRPIIGLGHSMGGAQLVWLSLMHPRLFTTLVLLEPVLLPGALPYPKPSPPQMSAFRRDFWPSRAEAEASFHKSKFYQRWDPRVLDKWLQYGLRETPSRIYPAPDTQGPVTLTTTKHQEVFTFMRPIFRDPGRDPSTGQLLVEKRTHADLSREVFADAKIYRPEPYIIRRNLPFVRPSVLYIHGDVSEISTPTMGMDRMAKTGVGLGGSGGAKAGRVKQIRLAEIGHLVAMESAIDTAEHAAPWIGQELERWRKEEDLSQKEWSALSHRDKFMLTDEWREQLGGDPRQMTQPSNAKQSGTKPKL